MSTSASLAVSRMIGTGLRPRTSRQRSRPLRPGIMMSRTSRSKGTSPVAELLVGVVAVGGDRDLEALLAERVAHRLADRGLVVGDQDPSAAHRVRLMRSGSALGAASRSLIVKMLPRPSSEETLDLAAHHIDHPLGDREAEPEALALQRTAAAVEALEDAILLRRRGFQFLCPRPRSRPVTPPPDVSAKGNGAGRGGVLEGVGQQADQHLAEQDRVGVGGEVGLDLGLERRRRRAAVEGRDRPPRSRGRR